MPDQAPLVKSLEHPVPGVATAGNDDSVVIGRAPFAGTVTAVTYTPDAAIAGANTNTRRVALVNRGQSGSGSTVIAELQFNAGVNATAFDERAITLSGTLANRDVADGDVLEWFSDAVGTGLADPGGFVKVDISRS